MVEVPMTLVTEVARRFFASLSDTFESKMQEFLEKPLDPAEGKELARWVVANFHFQTAKTPKGGKALKEALDKLHWFLSSGLSQQADPEKLRPTIESAWSSIKAQLDETVKLLSDEGGRVVPKELKLGANTYSNVSGFQSDQLAKYAEALEDVFRELRGWRGKALVGGLKVALAGPKEFRGTSAGKFKSQEDVLYVRATPQILKRTRGTYAAFDYIIVHELGHRYDYKYRPREDFDKPRWWTSKYSRNEGESFAELFAISNFNLTGPWDSSVLDRFEDYMTTGRVEERSEEEVERIEKVRGRFENLRMAAFR